MRLPPIRQLQYLVALRSALHFGKAAEQLHVTQSTLSAGLRELEASLGLTLVERSSKSVHFTPAGEQVVARARQLLMQAEDLVAEASGFSDPLALPVRIGAIPTIAPYIIGPYASALRRAQPRVQLNIRENTTAQLVAELLDASLDLALLALPYDLGRLETRIVYREGMHLAWRKDSALGRAPPADFDSLPDESLLLLDDGHCLRDHALAGCRLKNKRKLHTFGANSLQMLLQMVDNDLGLTLVPDMALAANALANTRIATAPLPRRRFYRDIGFAWRKEHSRQALLQTLMDLLPIPTA